MLFDPKWKMPEVETKPPLLSLAGLIAWLETQPSEQIYCYEETGGCLLAQYFQANGDPDATTGSYTCTLHGKSGINLPRALNEVAVQMPRTFGAALDRARKLAATQGA